MADEMLAPLPSGGNNGNADPHLRARDLPRLRDEMRMDSVVGRDAILRQMKSTTDPQQIAVLARGARQDEIMAAKLEQSELYFVTEDMTKLAIAAARTLPDDLDILDPLTWPSDFGIMYFEHGLGFGRMNLMDDNQITRSTTYADYARVRVFAVLWGRTANGVALNIAYTINDPTLADWSRAPTQRAALITTVDRLTEDGFRALPRDVLLTDSPIMGLDDVARKADPDRARSINAALYRATIAACLIMKQTTLSTVTRGEGRGSRDRRAPTRRAMVGVTIVDLRKSVRENSVPGEGGHLTVRFPVRAYWRRQRVGSGSESHVETVYVHSHFKGPNGAPIMIRDVVNVFRR